MNAQHATKNLTKTTKAVVGARAHEHLVCGNSAYSAPPLAPSQAEQAWMDRASHPNTDGVGN